MSLSTLYKEIEDKAKVDRSSREIQDISSAVKEMLERLVSCEIEIKYKFKFETTLKFRGADLQPCGSMHEETSLWKSTRRKGRENKFLECDCVVILHNEDNEVKIRESRDCRGCREVVTGDRQWLTDRLLFSFGFNGPFLLALYSLIDSKCSCHVDPDQTFSKDDRRDSRPCPNCTVAKDTGHLQIAKIPDISQKNVKHSEGCSLVFYWTSYTDSLLAPNIETLQPTERIGRLVIRVDVLSAFTLPDTRDGDKCEKELLIIGKDCPYCHLGHFMVSYCLQELRALEHVSDQHKQCFIIIKFLYGQFIYWTGRDEYINSYHAKVAFLTHCEDCTDEQKDCTTCITEILQSLVEAYRSGSLRLPEFHPMYFLRVEFRPASNFSRDDYPDYHHMYHDVANQIPILFLLHVISQLKTQYRPCHVVGLIKRTCRKLLEQDRPGIMDMDGRPLENLENTVSALDILAVLLSDKDLCSFVVCLPYDDETQRLYYRHLHCPEPERGLLWWRVMCMAKMIMASDITHIKDETIKKAVEDVQVYAKKKHEERYEYTQLLFLTSSQSVTEMSNNDSETSSPTPSLDGSCNNTTGWNVPTDSIFTDDLQLNWSALNTKQLREKMRREIEEEEKRRANKEEELQERLIENWEKIRRNNERHARERREKERQEFERPIRERREKARQEKEQQSRERRYMSTRRLCPGCLIPQKSLSSHVRNCCVYMTETEREDAILEEHNREKDLHIVSYEIKQLKNDFPESYLDIATVLIRSHIPVYIVVTEKQPPQYEFRRIKRLSEEDIDQIRKVGQIDESTTTEIHSNIPTTTTAQCTFSIETMAQQKTTKGSVASIAVKEATEQNRPAQHTKRHRTTIEEGASKMPPGYNPKRQGMSDQGMPEMPGGLPWTMSLSVCSPIQEQISDVRQNYNGNEPAGGATSQSIGHISKGAEETVTIVGKDVASPRSFKIMSDALTTPMTPYGDAEIGCPSERDTEEEIPTSASISEDARQIMSVDRDSSTVLPISTPVFVGISEDASLSKAGSSSVIPTFTSGFIRTTSTSGRLGSTAAVSTSFPSHSRQSSVVGSLETPATTVRKSTERKKKKVSHDDVTEAQFEVLQLQKEKLRAQTEKLVVQIKNIQLKNKKLERELADN